MDSVKMDNISYIRRHLKKKLDEDRYEHTIGVAYTSVCLAMKYGADLYQAEIAGLLHDCAKCLPDPVKLEKCEKYKIPITDAEKANPSLLHAKLGAALAAEKYNIKDEEILNAIRSHTTGRAGMSLLEKIVFTADYIEPRRDKASNLTDVRRAAFENLDLAVWIIMEDTLKYLKTKGASIDSTTEKACMYYRNLMKGSLTGQLPTA